MRKFEITLGIILAVVVMAVALFVATFNVNRYRGTIQSQLEQRLGRKVALGEMNLKLFPPRFRVQNLVIADDPTFGPGKPFVQAQQLDVSVRLLPLFHNDVWIDSLELLRPSVELIKNQQGIWNFSSLSVPPPSTDQRLPQSSPGGAPESSTQDANQFSLAKLTISDGQLAITDLQSRKARAVYDHIDASVRNFAPNEPFSFDVVAHLPGAGTQVIGLQGQVGPIVKDKPASTAFQGTVKLEQVGIAGLQKFLDSPALANSDGVLSGQSKISSDSGTLAANGKIKIENARMGGHVLGYTITADYDVKDEVSTDVITIRNSTLTLGTTSFLVNGTIDTKHDPAQLDIHLKTDNVSITEAAKLAAASGVALAPGTTVAGKLSANIQARGAADKPALSGSLSGQDIQISGKDIPQPVNVKSINLVLTPVEIHSDNFNVTSGGTTFAAQFALRQYLSNSPFVDASLRASNAALPEVLSMAKAYGVTGLDKISGAGTLNMDMRATGLLKTLTSAEVVKTLNGALGLNLNNVHYAGIDIDHQLASIGGFLKSNEKDQGFTNISRMTGDIVVKNGIAQTNNLLAQLDAGKVGAAGTTNLVTQLLDMRLTAVMSKDFSQNVGGTGISGYLNTALANNQGELVIPAIVTGTFQNPKFAPDLKKVAEMKMKGLVPNSSDPLGGVSGVLGGLLGQKKADQPQQKQPQQPDSVQQLIDMLGGKKQQPKPTPPPPK